MKTYQLCLPFLLFPTHVSRSELDGKHRRQTQWVMKHKDTHSREVGRWGVGTVLGLASCSLIEKVREGVLFLWKRIEALEKGSWWEIQHRDPKKEGEACTSSTGPAQLTERSFIASTYLLSVLTFQPTQARHRKLTDVFSNTSSSASFVLRKWALKI